MKRLALVCMILAVASAQQKSNRPVFELASMKRLPLGTPGPGTIKVYPNKVVMLSAPLQKIMTFAYDRRPFEVLNPDGKRWVENWKLTNGLPPVYNVEGQFPEGTKSKDVQMMVQNLLKERFDLKCHLENREVEALIFTAPKNLPKNIEFVKEGEAKATQLYYSPNRDNKSMEAKATSITVLKLLDTVSAIAEYPVIDETGFGDRLINITWSWPSSNQGPGISGFQDSLRESLYSSGFVVTKKKVMRDVLIVDHVNQNMVEN